MKNTAENRVSYRRYSDRRNALLLNIYEILFDNPAGLARDGMVLEAILENFQTDQAAFVIPPDGSKEEGQIAVAVGDWGKDGSKRPLLGVGVKQLWDLQQTAPGALTFTRVKRPTLFQADTWENLWNEALHMSTALLSVQIPAQKASPLNLWLIQTAYSREWSSRDRDLSEEVAKLLARARDRAIERQ